MKKHLPFLICLFVFGGIASAEGIIILDGAHEEVTNDTIFITGDASESMIKADIFFHNDTEESQAVLVQKIEVDVLEGTNNAFCWNGVCFSPAVYEAEDPIVLEPGETSSDTDFYAEYYPDGHAGISIIKYHFFSPEESFDDVEVTVVFETEDATFVHDPEWPAHQLGDPMPNPALGQTTIPYALADGTAAGTLQIYTLNGSMVREIVLGHNEGEVHLDASSLRQGMYIVTLTADGRPAASRRLVVKR